MPKKTFEFEMTIHSCPYCGQKFNLEKHAKEHCCDKHPFLTKLGETIAKLPDDKLLMCTRVSVNGDEYLIIFDSVEADGEKEIEPILYISAPCPKSDGEHNA